MKRKSGFTLIEMMIVLVIIGILAGLTLTAFVGTRKTARDGKRKADLEMIASALEMYRTDKGHYPRTEQGCGNYNRITGSDCLSNTLEPGYISDVPLDPINNGTGAGPCGNGKYGYMYGTERLEGKTFRLWTHLEAVSEGSYTTNCDDNPYGFTCDPDWDCYVVKNP